MIRENKGKPFFVDIEDIFNNSHIKEMRLAKSFDVYCRICLKKQPKFSEYRFVLPYFLKTIFVKTIKIRKHLPLTSFKRSRQIKNMIPKFFFTNSWLSSDIDIRVAVISAKNHKRQRRKRQSVTAKREKSQTPKVLTGILTLTNLT